ncbi:hypothetical protein N7495_007474 [Penicillium taxi]|uniref:uncharacterized protein n=1 Tax=Penicillium taxi TaxID=168475 RepID=UPI002545824A|nr:uncharacterized protein N7495_007474 [Penicillium taxi]KAJ5887433.1 hypothetical protein N7495_007474 [Penicillium taxi]
MAYQFFAKTQSRSTSSSTSPSPLVNRQHNYPPIHPPPLQPPRSVISTSDPTHKREESFSPYQHVIPAGYATPHPQITIETVKTAHIPSLTRVTCLLLPIRYPNSFYTATITDPVIASLSRVAIYHDHPIAEVQENGSSMGTDRVIGGILCRLERPDLSQGTDETATNLYIQTLHLLSPYRGHGVAVALLNSLLYEGSSDSKTPSEVSGLVKHYNIRSVTAHVHEANEDGLKWYTSRGFKLQDDVVEGYYRRLKPSGARIVRLDVEWGGTQLPADPNAPRSTSSNDADDEDWEKVEVEDGDEGDHGVQTLGESRLLENEGTSRKRKADEHVVSPPH